MYQYPVEKHRSENSKKDAESLQEVLLAGVVDAGLHCWIDVVFLLKWLFLHGICLLSNAVVIYMKPWYDY